MVPTPIVDNAADGIQTSYLAKCERATTLGLALGMNPELALLLLLEIHFCIAYRLNHYFPALYNIKFIRKVNDRVSYFAGIE